MSNEKLNNLKEWINKNGYPFEMKVAKAFKKVGFEVSQSILYKDPETEKYRETDIIAHIYKSINGVFFNISFVIECKKTTDKPWVIFFNKELYILQNKKYPILASLNAHQLLNEIIKSNTYKSPLIFPDISTSGYGVVTAFTTNNDTSYSASQSIIKACEYFVKKSNQSSNKFCNIYIPIIVIEGDLYKAFLNDIEEIELSKINWSTVISTKSFEEQNSNIINIVSSNYLDNFAGELKENSDKFFLEYSNELKNIAQENPTNRDFFVY